MRKKSVRIDWTRLRYDSGTPEAVRDPALLFFHICPESIHIEPHLMKRSEVSKEKFDELAEEAKNNCPVSGVLNCEIKLNSTLI